MFESQEEFCELFEAPILDLILSNCVLVKLEERVAALESAFNYNGYYGRYTILKFPLTPHQDYIKIKVYLPDSKLEYSWPYNCYFDIKNLRPSSKKAPYPAKIPNQALQIFMHRLNFYPDITEEEISMKGATKHMNSIILPPDCDVDKLLVFFFKEGFMTKKKFIIHTLDILEVSHNLFDNKIFALL